MDANQVEEDKPVEHQAPAEQEEVVQLGIN
jgi:hypothetical protein